MEEPFDVRKKLATELGRIPPDQPKEDYAPKFKQPVEADSVLKNIPITVSFHELMKLEEFNREQLASGAAKLAVGTLDDTLARIRELSTIINDVITKAKTSGEWYQ